MWNKSKILYGFLIFCAFSSGVMVQKLHLIGKTKLFIKEQILERTPREKTIIIKYINQHYTFDFPANVKILWQILTEQGYKVIVDRNAKDYDIIIDGAFREKEFVDGFELDPRLNENPQALKLFYTAEAYMPDVEQYDFTIGFNFFEHPKYMRVPLYYEYYDKDVNFDFYRGNCNPNKPHFACFLVSNGDYLHPINDLPFDGVVARDRLFHLLSLYKPVLSGGKHLNNIGGQLPWGDDFEWLGKCKFTIAYENQSWNGYITEKPYKAYLAGTIPLYYADKSVLEDINKDAVIYAQDFLDENSLVEYIKKIDKDDDLYCKIWNQKLTKSPEQNYEVIKEKLRIKWVRVFKEKFKNKKIKHTI